MLNDIYRITVNQGGDHAIPHLDLINRYKGLELRATPNKAGSMTMAHLFFCISWVWLWMANLIPGGESDSGFFERIYVILKKGATVETWIGFLTVHNIAKANQGYRLSTPIFDEFQRITLLISDSDPVASFASSSAMSWSLKAPQSKTPSSRLLSAYSQLSNLSTPFPNPFPVPESDLYLIFGPQTPVAHHLRKSIPQSLLRFFEHAFLLVTENGKVMPFPEVTNPEGSIEISVESEKGPNGENFVTSSTIADAIVGIVYYMLHEGFSTTKITMVRPSEAGKRMRVGTIHISERQGMDILGGTNNATAAAAAIS